MDYEAIAQTWERLAKGHEEAAIMLPKPSGNADFDRQNALFAESEKLEARRCRLFAEDFRKRAQK